MTNLHDKKNIIFDLGNVVIDIDLNITHQRFKELGYKAEGEFLNMFEQSGFFKQFEIGNISKEEFVKQVQQNMSSNASYTDVVDAWNGLMLGYKEDRIKTLLKLKKTHKLYLLSNTNELHIENCADRVPLVGSLSKLFDKLYYSHTMNMSKPNEDIFIALLEDAHILASETLFLDDSPANVATAEKVGIESWLVEHPDDWVPRINALIKSK